MVVMFRSGMSGRWRSPPNFDVVIADNKPRKLWKLRRAERRRRIHRCAAGQVRLDHFSG